MFIMKSRKKNQITWTTSGVISGMISKGGNTVAAVCSVQLKILPAVEPRATATKKKAVLSKIFAALHKFPQEPKKIAYRLEVRLPYGNSYSKTPGI